MVTLCPQGGENRTLLPTTASQTEQVQSFERWEPFARHRFGLGQQDRKFTFTGGGNGLRINRDGEFIVDYPPGGSKHSDYNRAH